MDWRSDLTDPEGHDYAERMCVGVRGGREVLGGDTLSEIQVRLCYEGLMATQWQVDLLPALDCSEETRKMWDFPFRLVMTLVLVKDHLVQELKCENTGVQRCP